MILTTLFLLILSLVASPNIWNTPNDGNRTNFYFSYQKDVINTIVIGGVCAHAAVTYKGEIYDFMSHSIGLDGTTGGITLRIFENQGSANFKWASTNGNGGTELFQWYDNVSINMQPAPVVYQGVLYLFYSKFSNQIFFKTYDDATGSWSDEKACFSSPNDTHILSYGAAVEIGNRLCLVHHYSDSQLQISYTSNPTDPSAWQHKTFDAVYACKDKKSKYWNSISAITNTYMQDNAVLQKIQVAWINTDENALVAEYKFDDSGTLSELGRSIIISDIKYTSVALAQGTVYHDSINSTGNCTQLFLKKADTDNSYLRYRIQRWQSKEGQSFQLAENNLLPQNSPKKMWADKELNLTAVNFSVLEGDNSVSNINQYMVLINRCYDDGNHPLNFAWSRTDDVSYEGAVVQDFDNDITTNGDKRKYRQNIGYIEGTPPFHKNPPSIGSINPFVNQSALPITEVEYEYTTSTSTENELVFESNITTTINNLGFTKTEVAYTHSQKKAYSTEETHTYLTGLEADTICEGLFLYFAPILTRVDYIARDRYGTYLYPVYCLTMQMQLHSETEELGNGLQADSLQAYQHRKINGTDINFSGYSTMTSTPYEFVEHNAGIHVGTSVEIATGSAMTNTRNSSFKLNQELGEVFELEAEKSEEYSATIKSLESNKVVFSFRFNPALHGADVKKVQYYSYWLAPRTGMNNWWLKDTDLYPDQKTWCITYAVGDITLNDGTIIHGSGYKPDNEQYFETEEQAAHEFSSTAANTSAKDFANAIKCYPNPFSSKTRIKYQVGNSVLPENLTTCATKIEIFDIRGQQIAILVNENKAPGAYEVDWDASHLSPGLYFCSMQIDSYREVEKLMLLK